ncbi:hypothetical protein OAC89_04575 [Deltaproteobacteria bacterium]|nr:hypothetical protein [Deltaproteobacteria bacterium]
MAGRMCIRVKTVTIAFFLAFLVFAGCKGSDTREAVDDTVEEFAGKKKVDQMKQMERNIGAIQDQQTDRLNMLDDSEDDE